MRVRLEDVCEKESSKLKQSDVIDQNGMYPVYGASGYLGNINTYQQSNYYIAVVKDGAGIGRTMLLPPESSIIGTMQYLIPKDNVLPEYLYYVVKAKHLEKYFSGATIPHIYFKDYKNEQFDLVSFEEQREIINRLKKIEIIIDNLSKNLLLLDELVKARFVEMFGNPVIGTEKWPIHTVDNVAEAVDPQPSHRTPPIDPDGIPYVSIKDCDLKSGTIDFKGARKVSKNVLEEHLKRYELHDGDFIIGKIGTVGNPIFVPQRRNYALSANVVLVQPNKSVVRPYFLKYSFESEFVERQFNEAKNSTSQAAFGIQKVRLIRVMNPSLNVQDEFEKFAIEIDKSRLRELLAIKHIKLLLKNL